MHFYKRPQPLHIYKAASSGFAAKFKSKYRAWLHSISALQLRLLANKLVQALYVQNYEVVHEFAICILHLSNSVPSLALQQSEV